MQGEAALEKFFQLRRKMRVHLTGFFNGKDLTFQLPIAYQKTINENIKYDWEIFKKFTKSDTYLPTLFLSLD